MIIENVGNLVCPAEFDVGEHAKAMVYSVTEGEDKPLKYPVMFRSVDVVLLNKIDLVPHLDVDVDTYIAHVREVNPTATILPVSAAPAPAWGLVRLAAAFRPTGHERPCGCRRGPRLRKLAGRLMSTDEGSGADSFRVATSTTSRRGVDNATG